LEHNREKIESSDVMERLKLKPREFFLVSAHREENVDDEENLANLLDSLNALADKYEYPIIVSTHPRARKRIDSRAGYEPNKLIEFMKPMGFSDYCKLQMNAACVVSDSGTITEESSILNFPAVTIRQTHERPEGMDVGTLIMCGLKADSVLRAIDVVMNQSEQADRAFSVVPDYETDNVSKKVLRIILSYTDYVDRVIWGK